MEIDHVELARRGAQARLAELDGERTQLLAFLTPQTPASPAALPTGRMPMTVAQRKAVSRRMKASWAAKRKAKNPPAAG